MKKQNPILTAVLLLAASLSSCKKDSEQFTTTTNLTVVNAAVDMPAVKTNTRGNIFYSSIANIN